MPNARKIMPLELRLVPKALPDHSWQGTDICSVPQCQISPEDSMRVLRLLAILLREAIEFPTEIWRKMKLRDKSWRTCLRLK